MLYLEIQIAIKLLNILTPDTVIEYCNVTVLFRDLISEPNPNPAILEVAIGPDANFAFHPKVNLTKN